MIGSDSGSGAPRARGPGAVLRRIAALFSAPGRLASGRYRLGLLALLAVVPFGLALTLGPTRMVLVGYSAVLGAITLLVGAADFARMRAHDESDRAKSEFVSSISHELATPLTSIRGMISTVQRHWERLSPSERDEMLERAGANADSLAYMIEQLVDFARMDNHRLKVNPVVVRVVDSVRQLLGRLGPQLSGHDVSVDVPGHLHAYTDGRAFDHILSNLLTNAAKFSPKSSEIAVSAHEAGETIVVSVSDRGIGIPAGEVERIFERFYQVDPDNYKGTGVGLAIVREYLALVGGAVWVTSEPGSKTTFSFSLPSPHAIVLAPAPSDVPAQVRIEAGAGA